MSHIYIQYYKTKIGELILGSYEENLCLLDYRYRRMRDSVDKRIKKGLDAEFKVNDSEILQNTRKQIDEYLSGERKEFDTPLLPVGSDFQKRVWESLIEIKYGHVATYLDIARKINNEKAVRAVASANGANAIAIIIPCHRIIGNDGKLTGYAGGLQIKRQLLNLERENSEVNLFNYKNK